MSIKRNVEKKNTHHKLITKTFNSGNFIAYIIHSEKYMMAMSVHVWIFTVINTNNNGVIQLLLLIHIFTRQLALSRSG